MNESLEVCESCGREQLLAWSVKHELWNKISSNKHTILCLECFLCEADNQNIEVKKEDFTHLSMSESIFIHISPKSKKEVKE